MALKIKRGDTVRVITGKDKGKTGTVLHVEPKKDRVFVEGMNIQKRHQRPRSIRDAQRAEAVGGVIEKEGPIHISNVALVDPSTKKPTRVGHRVEEQVKDGVKRTVRVRFAKKSGKDL